MAAISITTPVEDLKTVFDNPKEVYFNPTATDDIAALSALDKMLPIIESQATIDTGSATVNRTKLIDGRTWASFATSGDPDIALQVASIDGTITDLFLNKAGAAITMTNTFKGKNFAGQGYNLSVKKVTGSLLYVSQTGSELILMPNVEIYASFNAGGSETAAYFNLQINPMENENGVAIAYLTETVAPGG
ncbi:hypothetical protein [Bacteroides reticulotermitis]|uniref:Uncharacterized protein n=2 Tax=Bacteroides reticulotermitis TaxID=1133319 RepID=W4URS1_9BACE|nr:hypothetical protein [Bacteroides reticulotermitis]MBB4043816.1 hypothetical protein [Bacteroides reticulotermitis]GAE83333.1 hypothetical protein JCM10512_1598 [Bacteroides reticulotermitis JCM 10512]